MLYNKNQFRKTNDKKVLHKIGKHWVAVSVATLMALGAGAVSTTVHANADTNAANGVRVTSNANVSHRTLANRQSANAQSSNSNSANPANNKYATLSVASTFTNHDEATKAAPDVTTTAGYKAASEAFANVKNAGVNENTDQVYAKDGSTNKSGSSLDSSILQSQASEIPSTASNGAYASDYNDFLTSQAISDAELGRWHGVSAGSYGSEHNNPTYNALSSDESAQPDNPYIKAYEGAQSAMSSIANNSYGSNSYNNTDSTDSNYASGFNAIVSEYNNDHVAYADNWTQFWNAYTVGYVSHNVSDIKLTNDVDTGAREILNDYGSSDLTIDGQNHIGNFSDLHTSPFQNQHHNLVVENFRKMYSRNYYGPFNEWSDNGGSVTFKNINYEGSQLFNGNDGIKLYIEGTVNVLSESSYNDPFDGVNTTTKNGGETGVGQQNVEIASMEMMQNAVFNGVENDGGNNIEIGHSAQGALTLDQNAKMHLINNNRTDVGTPEYNGPSTKALYDNGDVNIQQGAQLSIDANNGANAMYVASGHNVNIDGDNSKLITNVNGDSSDNNGPIQIAGKVNVENNGTFDANASNLGNGYNKTILNDASGQVNVTNGANFVITDTDSTGQPVLFHGSGLTIEDPGSNVEFNLKGANGTLYNSTLNAYSVILEKTGTDGVPYYLSKNGKFDTKDIDSANPYYELTTDDKGNVSYYDPVQNKTLPVQGNNGNISGSKDMKFIATPTSYFDGHIDVNQSDSNNNNYLVSGQLLLSNVTSGYINQPVYMRVYDNGVTNSNDRTQGMETPSTSDGEKTNTDTNKNDPVLYNYKLQPVTSNGSVKYLVYKANGSGGWAPTSQVFDVNGSGQTGSNTVNGSKSRIVPFTFQMQNTPKSTNANVAVDAHYVVSTQEDDIYDNGNGVAEKKSALNPQNGPQNAGGGNIPNVNGGIKNNADNNKKPNTPSGDNGIGFDNNITSDSNTASSAASETNKDSSNSAVVSNPTASNAVRSDSSAASSDSSLISSADNTYPWNSSQNSNASSAANNAASNAANADSWVANVDNSGAKSNSTVTSNDAKSAESSANNLSSGSAKSAAESDASNASGYVSGASKAASDASQASKDASVASSAASSASKAGDSVDASIASNSASSAAARANNDSKNASNDASAAASASNAVNNDINSANYKNSIASDSSNASSASNEVSNDANNSAVKSAMNNGNNTSNSNALQSDIASENSDSNVIKSSQSPYNSAQNSTDSSAANNADSAAANADSIVASVDSSSAASDSNAASSDASSAQSASSGLNSGSSSDATSNDIKNASEDASVASSAASDASEASNSASSANIAASKASKAGNSVAASIASNAASSAASRANNDNNIASNANSNASSAASAAKSDASAHNISYSNDIKSDSINANSASSEINKDSSNSALSGNTNAISTINSDASIASSDNSVISSSDNQNPWNGNQNSDASSRANQADSAAANADNVITSVDNNAASNNANNASNIANSASNSANGLNNDTPSASAASVAAKSDASNAASDASAASSAASDAKSASNDASSASSAASSASAAGDSIAASSASNAASSAAARANNDSNIASNAAINASSASNAVNSDRNATSFEPEINSDSSNANSAASEANSGASNSAVINAAKSNSSINNAISADIKLVNSDNSGIKSSDATPHWNNSQNSEASYRANNADSAAANVDSIIASVDNSGASSNASNAVSSANSVKSDASGLNSGSNSDAASSNAKVASKDASAASNAASDASIASSEASSASSAASSAASKGNSIAASSASIDASSAASRANTDSSNAANDSSNAASAASAANSEASNAGSVTPNNGPVNPSPSPAPFVPIPSVPTTPSVNPRPANGPSTVVQPKNNTPQPVHITNRHYPIQYNYHHSGNDVVTVNGRKYPVHYHNNGKNTVRAKVGKHYRNVVVSSNLPTPHVDSKNTQMVDHINFNRHGKRVFTKRGLMRAINHANPGEVFNYRGQKFAVMSVPSHFRYFMVKKNVLAHAMALSVGRVTTRRMLRKNRGLTIPIKRTMAVRGQHANYVRYEFSVHHHNFWITARQDYVPNAYLQKWDFADRKASHVKVMRGCYLYTSRHYSKRTYVKTLHRGTTLHVKKVVFLGAKGNYQTRLQLTNGDYVTANKNWVKVY